MKYFLVGMFLFPSFSCFASNSLEDQARQSTGVYVSTGNSGSLNRAQYTQGLKTLSNLKNVDECVEGILVGNANQQIDINDMVTVSYNSSKNEMENFILSNCAVFKVKDLKNQAITNTGVYVGTANSGSINRDHFARGLKTLSHLSDLKKCVKGVLVGNFNQEIDINNMVTVSYKSDKEQMQNFILSNCSMDL